MHRETDIHHYALWVLLPTLESDDPNLQYYYDFEPALAEYARAFTELGCTWQWRSVRLDSIVSVLDEIAELSKPLPLLIINLCDGDEINGVPGVSVVRELEKRSIVYTGAREYFYTATTSKIDMKKDFDREGVVTAPWQSIPDDECTKGIFDRCGSPLIVKPAVSGGSMGIGIRNVVHNEVELRACLAELRQGYHGWKLEEGGLLAERFIPGREFTTFIVGTGDRAYFYAPAERVFHESLPHNQRFLSFDRLWETYETESAMPDEDFVYQYAQPEESLYQELKELSLAAYRSVQGSGYGRIDIRQDQTSGKLYVLEVNAQCGLSEDENYTSIGAILRFSGESFGQLTKRILDDALSYEMQDDAGASPSLQTV